ncbi:hypothetical protein, partial [Catenulispora yoronensis]|uniref:hypothetical protein n=1 Tax=Catenulispora yoronensis TaxID=450799 RepID=UPI0031DDF45C
MTLPTTDGAKRKLRRSLVEGLLDGIEPPRLARIYRIDLETVYQLLRDHGCFYGPQPGRSAPLLTPNETAELRAAYKATRSSGFSHFADTAQPDQLSKILMKLHIKFGLATASSEIAWALRLDRNDVASRLAEHCISPNFIPPALTPQQATDLHAAYKATHPVGATAKTHPVHARILTAMITVL